MAGYVMKMNTLVPIINRCGKKDLSFKVRHKVYASRYAKFMKKIIFTIIISCFIQVMYGQSNEKRVYTTIFQGDSIITNKFFSQYEYDIENVHFRLLFDPNGDTTETVITYTDIFDNDSIEIWRWSDLDYYEIHKNYLDNQLKKEFTFLDGKSNNDTVVYQYNPAGNLAKRTWLYETFHPYDTLIYRNNLIDKIISYTPEEISEVAKYKYNKERLCVRILTFNAQNKRIRKRTYKYDSENRKIEIKELEYRPFSETKRIQELITYKYSEKGFLREYRIVDFNYHNTWTKYYNEDGEWVKTINIDNRTGEKRIHETE